VTATPFCKRSRKLSRRVSAPLRSARRCSSAPFCRTGWRWPPRRRAGGTRYASGCAHARSRAR
jgi:hypothetical protein